MDFLKKHYEKVLLGVVLLGLAVAVAFLPFKIASEKQKLEDMRNTLINPNVKPLTNLDLTLPDAGAQAGGGSRLARFLRAQQTVQSDALAEGAGRAAHQGGRHQHRPERRDDYQNGPPVSEAHARFGDRIGFRAALHHRDREGSRRQPPGPQKTQKYCRLGDKNDTFALREIKAAPDNPTNVTPSCSN